MIHLNVGNSRNRRKPAAVGFLSACLLLLSGVSVYAIGPGETEAGQTETAQTESIGTESAEEEEKRAEEQALWARDYAGRRLSRSVAGTELPWLFYTDAITEKQQMFLRKDLWWYKKVINEKLYAPLTQNGIRLVLMIVPDKDTLYGADYLSGEWKTMAESYDRVDQFMEYMREEFPQLEIYYAKEDMLRAKEGGIPLYYDSDSHWNFAGAYAAAEGLMNFLGEEYKIAEKPEITFEKTASQAGDLQQFEGLDERFNRTEYRALGLPQAEKTFSYEKPEMGNEEVYAEYRSTDARALPKKLYFCGDSYRWYIQYFLNWQFADSSFVLRYYYSAQDAVSKEEKPDVFVYQLPERFLPQLGSLIA